MRKLEKQRQSRYFLKLVKPLVIPSARNNEALSTAAMNGHLEIVKLLLADRRVNPADTNYAIILASMDGYSDIVKLLLDEGIKCPCEKVITFPNYPLAH